MAKQVPHMEEFRRDLQREPSIIMASSNEIFERPTDESNTQTHDVLIREPQRKAASRRQLRTVDRALNQS